MRSLDHILCLVMPLFCSKNQKINYGPMGDKIHSEPTIFRGNMLVFHDTELLAFENGVESDRTVLLIGGLGDTMCSLSFSKGLDELCRESGLKFINVQLRSQPNFSMHTIDEDIEDISRVASSLKGDIILIGHSTGCQDVLLYLEACKSQNIKGVILHAPISDIECLSPKKIRKNARIISDFGQTDSLFAEISGRIWLKERFTSLFLQNGREDLFSSYLDDKCYTKWASFGVKILSVVSGNDEFCVKDITSKLRLMGDVKVIDGADHALTQGSWSKIFVSMVSDFLNEI